MIAGWTATGAAHASIPDSVAADGFVWQIERAWPDGRGGAAVEARSPAHSSVRAGVMAAAAIDAASIGEAPVGQDPVVTLQRVGEDARLPALSDLARHGTVVSHRAGRRAVVRLADSFVKIVRPGRAAAVRVAHDRARAGGFADGFVLADLLSNPVDETAGALQFSALPGRTLHALGVDRDLPDEEFAQAWRAWGEGWSTFLGAGRHSDELPVHSAADEVAVVLRWSEHAQRLLPTRAPGIRSVASRVVAELSVGSPDPFVPSHRDLHDKQVLVASGRPAGILDLDTASRAEAALDLGNMRAHLAFRARQGHLSESRARVAQDVLDEVAEQHGVTPRRMAAYEAATALRLGFLYLFRPAWRSLAEEWLVARGV